MLDCRAEMEAVEFSHNAPRDDKMSKGGKPTSHMLKNGPLQPTLAVFAREITVRCRFCHRSHDSVLIMAPVHEVGQPRVGTGVHAGSHV